MTQSTPPDIERIARGLSPNQIALLDDLCGCPGLFAGQYVSDGAELSHLPDELVERTYEGASGLMGLAKAVPSPLGEQVRAHLTGEQP